MSDKKMAVDRANDQQPDASPDQEQSAVCIAEPAPDVKQKQHKDVTGKDKCNSCSAPIFWATTETALKLIPLDAQQRLDGNVQVLANGSCRVVEPGRGSYVAHFATCPDAGKWRRGRAK